MKVVTSFHLLSLPFILWLLEHYMIKYLTCHANVVTRQYYEHFPGCFLAEERNSSCDVHLSWGRLRSILAVMPLCCWVLKSCMKPRGTVHILCNVETMSLTLKVPETVVCCRIQAKASRHTPLGKLSWWQSINRGCNYNTGSKSRTLCHLDSKSSGWRHSPSFQPNCLPPHPQTSFLSCSFTRTVGHDRKCMNLVLL